jgi:hypothetical protein
VDPELIDCGVRCDTGVGQEDSSFPSSPSLPSAMEALESVHRPRKDRPERLPLLAPVLLAWFRRGKSDTNRGDIVRHAGSE